VDAAVFTEPIAGGDRPLISRRCYEEFVLRSYEPLLEVLGQFPGGDDHLLTFANPRALIPSILKWGFNCLWACEANMETMDYRDLRSSSAATFD